jgi:predicted nucleotidyltransferase
MSIADFMFSTPVQNILRTAYSSPGQAFMLNELIERAGGGRGNGQRQVERLLEYGVLKEDERRGRQRAISANVEFVLYPELLSICRKSFGLAEPIREALAPFADQLDEVFVFGSAARREDSHRSDIDLMVVGTASLLEVTEALFKVEKTLGRPVHLNMYTPEEWSRLRLHDPVIAQIVEGDQERILLNAQAR